MITKKFNSDLADLLKLHAIDKITSIPDNILAEYLCEYLHNLQKMLRLAGISKGELNLDKEK